MIGNGSNLLVSDSGYDGVIIDLGRHDGTEFTQLGVEEKDGEVIFDAGAGCLLSSIGNYAVQFEAAGFEALSGIPGCIGGACIMNAGAYGSEMKDVLVSVDIITREGFEAKLPAEKLGLGYRHSALMDDGSIVTRAEIRLKKGRAEDIRALSESYMEKRRDKQPLNYPSAGSTFKRPEGYFAGKLIEDAGLRGYSVGGAQVSEKHCGFIINRDGASSADIYRLIREVQRIVFEKHGVMLEPEVRLLGSFDA